ncbi:hypothetical protein AAFF_G00421970 [Aldrovandia affinis]|uniref:Spermatogenesis-associated protein 2 PUB-like domain-containing protein n=1 Tax=Aldrovandia affinis TaxID=143900 RepID=A0AAD7WJU6_9TELE|nr:hypothetical protein AAFF_G00421970 [Aldrovandia affinis]
MDRFHFPLTCSRFFNQDEFGRSSSTGVCEQYRVSLAQRIEQGDSDLVCGDQELCEKMEEMLREGAARDVHTAPGLDPLAVMEASLHTLPAWAHARLGALAGAFEVLERAALNLYLCPWRKEYRVVKMFSGMFTHLVRPVLPEQQVEDLFALLGYLAKGDELELHGPPPSAHILLQLACAFFAARCECRLLLSAAATSGGGANAERHLVQERRRGHSLREALESLQRKTAAMQCRADEVELDLYTAEGEESNGEREVFTQSMSLSFGGGLSATGSSSTSNTLTGSSSTSNTLTRSSSTSNTLTRSSSTSNTLKHQPTATSSMGSNTSHALNEYPRAGSGILSESTPSGDDRMGMSHGQNQVGTAIDLTSIYQCLHCGKKQSGNGTDLHRPKIGRASATAANRDSHRDVYCAGHNNNCPEVVFPCSACGLKICRDCFFRQTAQCAGGRNASTPV